MCQHNNFVAWCRLFLLLCCPNRKAQIFLTKVHFPPLTDSQLLTMHHCVRAWRWSSVCTVWHLWNSRRVLPWLFLSMRDRLMEEDKALTSLWARHRAVMGTNVPCSSDIPVEIIRRSNILQILYDKWIWKPNGSILSWVWKLLKTSCWHCCIGDCIMGLYNCQACSAFITRHIKKVCVKISVFKQQCL